MRCVIVSTIHYTWAPSYRKHPLHHDMFGSSTICRWRHTTWRSTRLRRADDRRTALALQNVFQRLSAHVLWTISYGGTVTIKLRSCHDFFLCAICLHHVTHPAGSSARWQVVSSTAAGPRRSLQRPTLTASWSAIDKPVTRHRGQQCAQPYRHFWSRSTPTTSQFLSDNHHS
jgi:hypothetical protein